MGYLYAPATDTLVFALSFAPASIDELFKQFMKSYLEAQTPTLVQAKPPKQLLKAHFPNIYYKNLYMDCYYFYYQCENHFKTVKAKRINCI